MSGSTAGYDATITTAADDCYFGDLAGYSLRLEDMGYYHWWKIYQYLSVFGLGD